MSPVPSSLPAENQHLLDRIAALENELAATRRAQAPTFQAFLDAVPMAIGILDDQCRYVAVNRSLAAFHGLTPEQHLGRSVSEVVPFLDGMVREAVSTVLRTGNLILDQDLTSGTIAAPDAVGAWSITWFPLQLPDRSCAAVGAIVSNTSERRKAEDALRQVQSALARQVAEFEALFQALPVGVGVARDPECREIQANPALARLLGMDASDNVSKTRPEPGELPFRVIQDGREIPHDQLPMQVAARTGREVRDFVYELVRGDGVTLTEYGHATPLFDEAGAVSGSIGVFLDFTELRRAQRELELANDELRRSNADLNHFAYAASHDLREPLRTIRLFSELLSLNTNADTSAESRQWLSLIGESAARMDQLLGDLMHYVEVATDHTQHMAAVDLDAVLATTRLNLQVAIAEAGAEISADPLPVVFGRTSDYIQIFQNLIGNAIKYRGDSSPVICIAAARLDGFWKFSIADNGVGIDPADTTRIFGLFKRLHGREIAGSGIGLAICERIVRRYGGRIWAESSKGQGSCFCFTMPATTSAAS